MTHDDRFFRYVRDFLLVYLPKHRCFSSPTVKSYRDTLQLLRTYLKEERHLAFTQITFDCLDHHGIIGFLDCWKARDAVASPPVISDSPPLNRL